MKNIICASISLGFLIYKLSTAARLPQRQTLTSALDDGSILTVYPNAMNLIDDLEQCRIEWNLLYFKPDIVERGLSFEISHMYFERFSTVGQRMRIAKCFMMALNLPLDKSDPGKYPTIDLETRYKTWTLSMAQKKKGLMYQMVIMCRHFNSNPALIHSLKHSISFRAFPHLLKVANSFPYTKDDIVWIFKLFPPSSWLISSVFTHSVLNEHYENISSVLLAKYAEFAVDPYVSLVELTAKGQVVNMVKDIVKSAIMYRSDYVEFLTTKIAHILIVYHAPARIFHLYAIEIPQDIRMALIEIHGLRPLLH